MHHGHSYLFTAGLFFALFYGLLLVVAYVPGLVRDTLRDQRRSRPGYIRPLPSASVRQNPATGRTRTPSATSTASKARPTQTVTLTRGRSMSADASKTASPTGSIAATASCHGSIRPTTATDAEL